MERMRLTAHNGRAGKNGVYSAKHNDRNFDVRQSDHIDESRSLGNWYWHWYMKDDPSMTFDDAEALYYESHFREALEERNERSIEARHPERVKTMDAYRSSRKTCPEEQIMQIGRKDMSVDPETLKQIAIEQINWEIRRYPNFKLLDVALHVDEQGAPHLHKRGVWVAHDDDGRLIVGQAKALAEMGIEAPDPSKKCGKYNNAKMTHTKQCREHLAELCRERGLDLEMAPKEHSKSGLALEEYQARQEQEKAERARQEVDRAYQEMASMRAEMASMRAEKASMEESTIKAQKALVEAQSALKRVAAERGELEAVRAQVEVARQELKKTLELKARAAEIRRPLFRSEPTVSYHENMLSSTRAIGSNAYSHMKAAEAKLQEVVKREAAVQQKEREIEPLHKKAKDEYDKAHDYEERQESYILDMAEKRAQEKFDAFISCEFGKELTGREARLEKFADSVILKDGLSVLDAFNEQEQERQRRLKRLWDWNVER